MIQNNQDRTDVNLKEIRAGQEFLKEEILAKLDARHERIMAQMDQK
jgi:hypothetical protein